MALFEELDVWIDGSERSGPAHMAVDELLHTHGWERPLLRFYQWSGEEVSLGYFERLSDAQAAFPGEALRYVRRWTGGGVVDHRCDVTYTICIPKGHVVEQMRGDGSYAAIHAVLAEALLELGVACALTDGSLETRERACFGNPVRQDIVDAGGRKLAGAGQKRSRYGILHQGSVQGVKDVAGWRQLFAAALADRVHKKDIAIEKMGDVSKLVAERYGAAAWTEKRP
ncbi:lipoyl protein ligase domain-containing protein [Rubritalea tangerina]|uniref:BPL/LPL catalytic domain-containing protein n=1 Tax=Rubritalea tangerina TaxID=430798 RepID=A0ABW4Z8R5_9BACT